MRVLCTLPNAAEVISGIAFTKTDGGMLSEPVDAAVAAHFASIPGYVQVYQVESELGQPGGIPEPEIQAEAVDEPTERQAEEQDEPSEAVRRGPGRPRKTP